ncbi:MAG: PEGA domain-containing protein [Defluviitaleaceae bacterium]|nr:PEGA domain-containing protein [Defluviitaleaceae bacterium]
MDRRNNSGKKRKLNFEDDDFLFSDSPKINRKTGKTKNEYIVFYALAAIASITVLVIIGVIFFNQFGNNDPIVVVEPPTHEEENDDSERIEVPQEYESLKGMITGIDSGNRMLLILNLDTRTPSNLVVQTSSNLRGGLGNAIIFEELRIGDIIEVDHSRANIINLIMSENAWERRAVVGLEVLQNNRLQVGHEILDFNSDTVVLNQGSSYNVYNIHSLNQVTMRGVGNTVWFIEVNRGFGTAQAINGSNIINGRIDIDRTTIPLGPNAIPTEQTLELAEGTHRAVISGENIITDTRDIEIIANETTIIDLSNVELTGGHLLVNLNAVEANVVINGILRNIDEPIFLNFGAHIMSITAPGFVNYERMFELENHNQTLHVTLEVARVEETQTPEQPNLNQPNGQPGQNVGGFPGTNQPQIQTGRVDIRSIPAGASLFVDGTLVGTTPFTGSLEVGNREIRIQMEGFINTQATLSVDSGINNPVEYELQPLPTAPQPGFNNQNPPNDQPPIVPSDPPGSHIVPPPGSIPNDPSLPQTPPVIEDDGDLDITTLPPLFPDDDD